MEKVFRKPKEDLKDHRKTSEARSHEGSTNDCKWTQNKTSIIAGRGGWTEDITQIAEGPQYANI